MDARVTVPAIRSHKVADGGAPLVMVTAYDTPSARMVDEAGADLILVGDSLGMVVLGHDNTLGVGVPELAHHTAAVARASPRALLVADMPWLSYHRDRGDTVGNAGVLVRAGAAAVKLEGGRSRVSMVEALTDAQIPVMGHLGLTPQSVHVMGGFRVQAREEETAAALVDDARALVDAGAFAIVIEGVPAEVAAEVTGAVAVPTIGIGAGRHCDGQVLVFHDLLGLQDQLAPRFVRRYAELKAEGVKALAAFASDVRSGAFPTDTESYHRSRPGG
ncbi:MAG: 3-methyl-2-oxobutanoate hydroxymethyltransferase [Actinobacteria bacterium]|nr:3-methyl-2-oxobutanoate hydroxymethyltransferase [Actinomycetota bacterium]MBW3642993.1 3-methyl-2-oxobutanoate hydroxymethyltransferase [Actinomycetota bacterium]